MTVDEAVATLNKWEHRKRDDWKRLPDVFRVISVPEYGDKIVFTDFEAIAIAEAILKEVEEV